MTPAPPLESSSDLASLSGRRVVIAGINYWPEETGNAPYTTGLAEHLAARGADVTVLTGMPYYPQWRVPREYAGRLRSREQRNDVDIRRFRTYIPGRQTAVRRILFEGGFGANAALAAGIRRPDAVIGVVPSLGGGAIAAGLAGRFNIPMGLVFQDLVGGAAAQSGMPGGKRVANVTRRLEGWIGRRADRVAVVSDGFRPYLVDLGVLPARTETLRNWSHIAPPAADRAATRARLGWAPEQRIILHAGAMGLKQGLENVVDAARLAGEYDPSIRFVFLGDGNQRPLIEQRAAGCANIEFRDPAPAADFPDTLAAADVLLINERGSVVDMSLPSKLTSYLVAGRPIVAAVNPAGQTGREVVRTGAGLAVPADDPQALFAAIRDLVADEARLANLAQHGAAYARDHLSAPAALARAEGFVLRLLGSAATTAARGDHATPAAGLAVAPGLPITEFEGTNGD